MTKTIQKESQRLLSLDFFRGFTMFLLIVEFTGLYNYLIDSKLSETIIYPIAMQFHHHPWNGMRFWDLIQPFFMFIVGVAMPFSYSKRLQRGDSYQQIRKHIFQRSFLLLILGWMLYCIPYQRITFYFQNVLAQLAVTIPIAYVIMRKSPTKQIIISFVLLIITELAYRFFWVEGFNRPFTPDHNLGAWFDVLISGNVDGGHWVSINAIPTAAHTIWGVLAGQLLLSKRPDKQKLYILCIAGAIALIIGYALSPITPIIKRIATSSFVLVSGGWTILALAFSYWIIDIKKINVGVHFFAIVGMNPLFIYLFAHVGGAQLVNQIILPFTSTALNWAGELTINIATSAMTAFALWYICYTLYKHKIFIRI